MAGRQVLDVPSTYVGGSAHCIALSIKRMDIQKVSQIFLQSLGILLEQVSFSKQSTLICHWSLWTLVFYGMCIFITWRVLVSWNALSKLFHSIVASL